MPHAHDTRILRQLRRAIGFNIYRQRVIHGVTLHKLAHLTGLPPQLLDRYELGKNEITLNHLFYIAAGLRIDLADLLSAPGACASVRA